MFRPPQNLTYKKNHKVKISNIEYHANKVSQGEYGLMALESGYLTIKQLESARKAIIKTVKKLAKLYAKVMPNLCLTKKPTEVRMGKGKGTPTEWVAPVKRGRIIFEISGVPEDKAEEVLLLGAAKLPIKTKFVLSYS